jgi:hypothetical protein
MLLKRLFCFARLGRKTLPAYFTIKRLQILGKSTNQPRSSPSIEFS